jgi:mRNA degradation ribonuclease J1/J2
MMLAVIDPQFIFPHNTEDSRLVFHLDASFSALVDA